MKYLSETPWDKRNFGINTYELTSSSEEALQEADEYSGHITIKIDPLENPEPLLRHGFYYVDTLTKPVCKQEDLQVFNADHVHVSTTYDPDKILSIAKEAFTHGRFHRDFHIPDTLADKRYQNWVNDLLENQQIFALMYGDEIAGFYGFSGNQVLLLGIHKDYRGRGFTKAFTSLSCQKQFQMGYDKLTTSISAANAASLNLFFKLGFQLQGAEDVYHKINGDIN